MPRLLLIDGTGAPPQGPVDIVIENNRIKSIRSAGRQKIADDGSCSALPGGFELLDQPLPLLPRANGIRRFFFL